MPPRQTPEELPPELSEMLEELGIDPGDIYIGGGGEGVLTGGIDASTPIVAGYGWDKPGLPPTMSTVGKELGKFYRFDNVSLTTLQALMFAAGYYGEAEITDVRWGVADDQSFSAWSSAVATAARAYAANPNKPLSTRDILTNMAISAGVDPEAIESDFRLTPDELGDLAISEPELISREGNVISILLSDPNELRSSIDQVSSAVLGRKANSQEQRMFISMIHNLQRSGQTAVQTAEPGKVVAAIPKGIADQAAVDPAAALALDESIPTPEDVTVEYAQPDIGSQAEALLRQQNPAEAGAHDIAIQFGNFLDLLRSPVQLPSRTV